MNKHKLEEPWTTALDPMDLLEATNQEIQASSIKIAKKTETPDNPYKRTGKFYRNQAENPNNQNNENENNRNNENRTEDRPTERPERPERIDDTNRYAFPAEHPNSLQFYKHLKELKEQGKTKEYIITTYKNTYTDPGCFICRLKENHQSFHTDTECRQLKRLYPYSSTSLVSCSSTSLGSCSLILNPSFKRPSFKPVPKQPTTNENPIKLCYDTGTVPDTLTGNRDIFKSYTPATTPEHVLLGDGTTAMPILGSGIIDIVVDNNRIQLEAKHVKQSTSLILFSAAQHSKYKNCEAHIKHQQITVHFPTFSFTVHASKNFECPISKGTQSSLPVSWSPTMDDLIHETHIEHEIKIKLLNKNAIIPSKGTPNSSGYDIAAAESVTIQPGKVHKTKTGISIEFPKTIDCCLRPRSGLTSKRILIGLGTIDPDY